MSSPVGDRAVAAIFVTGDAEDHLPTLVSLRRAHPDIPIVCGAPATSQLAPLVDAGAVAVRADSAGALVNLAWETYRAHVLVIDGHVGFPTHGITAAIAIADEDLRLATVSLLANVAGWLSFPFRNQPSIQLPPGLDEEVVTRRLRAEPGLAPVPIALPAGPAVLLSSLALSALAPLTGLPGVDAGSAITELSVRARRKGFLDVADPSTFCMWFPTDATLARVHAGDDSWPLADVFRRHPSVAALVEDDRASDDSPIGVAHRVCRAKVLGLRVLIDGSCLGPREMGTQIQTVALIQALARRPDVERVSVAVPGPTIGVAGGLATDPKIDVRVAPNGDVSRFAPVDIIHRPFQPDQYLDMSSWPAAAARSLVTILDLIAYQVGPYHGTTAGWMTYRRLMHDSVRMVDGIVVPSEDVRRQIELERLPVEADRLSVVGLGTDHLTGDEPEAVPAELLARRMVSEQFAVVLGSNYGHKNRDLAIRTLDELRRRGYPLALVLVGAAVPFGSSRNLEAQASVALDGDVLVLPDATAQERNWLLRHAAFALYPTSAEGFGFIPYEAARFGTPTVLVGVGPLSPLAARLPVVAAHWHPTALADAAERLLTDPALAAQQSAAVRDFASEQTWDAAAAGLVEVYRRLLSRPALSPARHPAGLGAVLSAR